MTGLTGRLFFRSGTESNALRGGLGRLGPSAVEHGSEAGTGNDVMATGNDHVTAGQVSNNTLMGFFFYMSSSCCTLSMSVSSRVARV